jgi:CRP/FNR family transcriptional regulator
MFSLKILKKHCSKEWLPVFELNNKIVKVKAKERIFSEGDAVKYIYFIESGTVKVLSKFNEKEEKIIRIAGDGMILGHRGINAKNFPVTAETLTETVVTSVPMDVFLKIIKANPNMSVYLINFMSDELRDGEERMKTLLILDPKVRIAIILVRLIDHFGYDKKIKNKPKIILSRTDIANMAGTTYETVIRTLALFKDSNILQIEGKQILLIDEKELRRIASHKVSTKRPAALVKS